MRDAEPNLPLTYEFRTVGDFLAIPPEKLGACLIDFHAWLLMVQAAKGLADQGYVTLTTPTDMFGWVDDGKHVATVTMQHEGETIAVNEHEFAPAESLEDCTCRPDGPCGH